MMKTFLSRVLANVIYDYIEEEKNKEKILSLELCAGRHLTPAQNGAIFENEIDDVTDTRKMYEIISNKLYGVDKVILYVTGLTVALVEVINYCNDNGVELTLMHYNKETDSYYEQIVVEYEE